MNKNSLSLIIVICLISFISVSSLLNAGNIDEGSFGIGRGRIILEIFSSFYILINAFFLKNKSLIISVSIALWLTLLITSLLNNSNSSLMMSINMISNLSYWILVFLFAYVFVKKNKNGLNLIQNYTIFSFLILSYYYFYTTYFVNNINFSVFSTFTQVYYILLIMPFILLSKTNYSKALLLLLLSFAVIISFKRAAFFAFFISLGLYYLNLLKQQRINNRRQISNYLLIFSVILIAFYFFEYIEKLSSFLMTERISTMQQDQGSGRIVLWFITLDLILNTDLIGLIIGHGYDAVSKVSIFKTSSHNDFLEIFYDYGIIAFSFYLMIYHHLIKYLYKLYKINSHLYAPVFISLILFFLLSFFSHLIVYPTYFVYITLFWGATIAEYEKELIEKINIGSN